MDRGGSGVGRTKDYDELTPAEWKVATLVARGLMDSEIATQLNISPDTVKSHLRHATTKLDLNNRVQLAVWYTEERIAGRVPGLLSEFRQGASVRPKEMSGPRFNNQRSTP